MAKMKPSSKSPASQPTFEQGLERLEQIVHDLEEGQLGLSESLTRYEEGVKCLKQCYGLLQGAERKIELLTRVDDQGAATTEPFDEGDTSPAEKSQRRSRRRSRPKTSRSPADGGDADPQTDVDSEGSLF